MRRLIALLLAFLVAGPAFGQSPAPAQAPAQAVVKTDNVRAELISEVSQVKPGEPFWVALRLTIRPHWHTYWKNPGDSGLPTEINWTLPAGVKADSIDVEFLGAVNIGHRDSDELDLPVHAQQPTRGIGQFS